MCAIAQRRVVTHPAHSLRAHKCATACGYCATSCVACQVEGRVEAYAVRLCQRSQGAAEGAPESQRRRRLGQAASQRTASLAVLATLAGAGAGVKRCELLRRLALCASLRRSRSGLLLEALGVPRMAGPNTAWRGSGPVSEAASLVPGGEATSQAWRRAGWQHHSSAGAAGAAAAACNQGATAALYQTCC